jgi:hypothetical protein
LLWSAAVICGFRAISLQSQIDDIKATTWPVNTRLDRLAAVRRAGTGATDVTCPED